MSSLYSVWYFFTTQRWYFISIVWLFITIHWASQVALLLRIFQQRQESKEMWFGKIPWRRERLPTPVFWPGECHGLLVHGVAKSQTQKRHTFTFLCLYLLDMNLDYWKAWVLKDELKVTQSCPALCDPMVYAVHGILQARILEWVAIPSSRGSSRPKDQTQVSCIARGFFTVWASREAPFI